MEDLSITPTLLASISPFFFGFELLLYNISTSSSCIYAFIPVFISVGAIPFLKLGIVTSSAASMSYPAEYFVFLIGRFIPFSSNPFAISNPLIFSISFLPFFLFFLLYFYIWILNCQGVILKFRYFFKNAILFFMPYKKRPPVKVAPPLGAKFCFTGPILFSKARPVNQNLAF